MEIVHDRPNGRFVARLSEGEAALRYAMADPYVMDIQSTFVPPAARGQGVAAALVRAAMQHAEAQGWSVIPSCWYVRTWVSRNPDYEPLLRG